jgi:hypothetical protein
MITVDDVVEGKTESKERNTRMVEEGKEELQKGLKEERKEGVFRGRMK